MDRAGLLVSECKKEELKCHLVKILKEFEKPER